MKTKTDQLQRKDMVVKQNEIISRLRPRFYES